MCELVPALFEALAKEAMEYQNFQEVSREADAKN